MLEFDLYNDNLKIAVEHHGSHRYRLRNKYDTSGRLKQQQKHDELKQQYLQKKRHQLFEIPELFSIDFTGGLTRSYCKTSQNFGLNLLKEYRERWPK